MSGTGKANKKRKIKPGFSVAFKIILVVFFAVTLIFFSARMLGGITLTSVVENIRIGISGLGAGDGYPFEISGSAVKKAYADGSKLFVFSDDKTLYLSSSAKELSKEPVEYGLPAIDYNNGKAIVYDRDSGKYRIQNTSQIVEKYELKNTVSCAAIGKKGNFAVSTVNSNNQTVLNVFSKSNKTEFTWNFAGQLVTSISLSDDGKFACVGIIEANNAQSNSKVYVFKFDSEDYISCFDYPGNVVVDVNYVKGHDIEVITDKKRFYIEDNSTQSSEFSFDSNILHDICQDDKYTAISYLKYGSDSNVVLNMFKGDKLLYNFDLNSSAKSISCQGRYLGVLTDSSVIVYNQKGEKIKEISVDVSATDIVITNKKVYIITPIEIICESF